MSQRLSSLTWTVTQASKQAKKGPRHSERQLQVLLCNSPPLEGLSVYDLWQAECCLHPPSELQTNLPRNSTHTHKALCHCLEPCPESDKEKNDPITLLQSSQHTQQWSTFPLQVSKGSPAAAGSGCSPSATPPKGCQGQPWAGSKGRAQPSRLSRAIMQEEVRKDPPDTLDFLAALCSLMP